MRALISKQYNWIYELLDINGSNQYNYSNETRRINIDFLRSFFSSSSTILSKLDCLGATVDSSCHCCEDKLAYCVFESLIQSATSCNS